MTIAYKRVAAGFYTDPKIAAMGIQPPHPTTLLQWLLTGPVLGVLPGCASIGRYGMAEQSGWSPCQIDEMMGSLVRLGIVQFDPSAPMIWMPNAIRYNAPSSPLNVTSWASDWRKLPQCVLKERAWHVLQAHCQHRDAELDSKAKKTVRNSFMAAFRASIDEPELGQIYLPEHSSELCSGTESFDGRKTKEKEQEIEKDQEQDQEAATQTPRPGGSPAVLSAVRSKP